MIRGSSAEKGALDRQASSPVEGQGQACNHVSPFWGSYRTWHKQDHSASKVFGGYSGRDCSDCSPYWS